MSSANTKCAGINAHRTTLVDKAVELAFTRATQTEDNMTLEALDETLWGEMYEALIPDLQTQLSNLANLPSTWLPQMEKELTSFDLAAETPARKYKYY